MDLATALPAATTTQEVRASLAGLEFRKTDGGTETVRFNDPEPMNLLDLADDQGALRLFTDEELPEGSYNGVRLLFDDTDTDNLLVLESDGTEREMTLETGDYVAVAFSIEDDESSQTALTLTLDLRQSLSLDPDEDSYTLRPRLRSVRTGDAATVSGVVNVTCATGSSLAQGGAVYLFEGMDQEPDDRDGSGIEPYATTAVTQDGNGTFAYELRSLPAGDYTISVSCNGDEENPREDDDLDFLGSDNLQLDESETLQLDIS